MKILCFIDNLGSGGAQRRFTNLAVLFRKAGHQISFLTYSEGDFFKKRFLNFYRSSVFSGILTVTW